LNNKDFAAHFGRFKSKVEYLTTRFRLRQHRVASGSIGTLIAIGSNYKSEVAGLLDTIRKIVSQEVKDVHKRDNILSKIASLQSEVDRDQTTVDALFSRMLDLSQTIGKAAENIEPLVKLMERVKKVFWDAPEKVRQLPRPERQKLIRQDKAEQKSDMDDEIPF
jgi:predicted  nucleic acid-binding Zn-ribbon protein